ncbi:MAG: hypothetical protein IJY16_00350 [Clostridia bacterium]|nr:hypothetical protein [Clostridia bacterium]
MKKLVLSVFLCLLVLCLTLPCFASFPTYDHYRVDDAEYLEIIKNNPPPKDFVTYDKVAFLGDLREASFDKDYGPSYYYSILTEEETIGIYFNTFPFSHLGMMGVESFPVYRYLDLVDDSNMLLLNMDAVAERLQVSFDVADYFYLDIGEVTYWYNYVGNLIYIELINVDHWKCNITVDDCEFSKCAEGGWISRLLDFETAAATAIEIKARIAGFYREPWEQPLAICLSAIGGAVVAGVSAWLITFLVMRKKRGAPAPAMAGVPAGEVLAGSDEDVSAAPSGAAPAAPESPAASESPTPPEEDTKTDTPGRS